MQTSLVAITADDIPAFLLLNNLALPHVNELDEDALGRLIVQSWYCKRVFREDNQETTAAEEMLGFLMVLTSGQPYESLNYRWFSDRYDQFAYVDRIVVAEASRGSGFAARLYEDLFESARLEGLQRVCCEVNLVPPNPGSLAFHAKLGFVEVGQQETEGGSKKVSLLIKELE
ncbi:MAG: putative GNAT superfamily acetyltransferase [Planctomycetaceae bacterium]|jgi:predicted GNAT superfamily acetyltransferase